jgi:hypothetical protein
VQHAVFRLQGFDVVYQRRPTVESVLLRERVLCLRQLYRRIGSAQRIEMFLGLLAELLERGTFRQTTARRNGHDDLLSNTARVRSSG